jgi:hypothetical protein
MTALIRRLADLLRPSEAPPADPIQTLTFDLIIAVVGFAIFGASIAAGGGASWRVLVALKVTGAFLTAFVLSLPPLFAIKRFFGIEAGFAAIVSGFAGSLALGGVFTAASAGLFVLLRRGEVDFDGALSVLFVALAFAGVLIGARRRKWLHLGGLPLVLAVGLYVSLLGQSAWAYRPYMDPASPTLFQEKVEWFTGGDRRWLERIVLELGGKRER